MKVAPFGNMGRHFYSFLRKRAIGKSPLATSWPSPAPQAVGRKKVYRRSLPPLWNWSGQVSVVAEKSFHQTTTKRPGVSNCPSCPMSSVSAWSTAAAHLGSNDFIADSDFIRIFMSYCVAELLK